MVDHKPEKTWQPREAHRVWLVPGGGSREDMTLDTTELAPVDKLSRELAKTGGQNREQARSLVDMYYRFQEHRIALRGRSGRVQGADRSGNPAA